MATYISGPIGQPPTNDDRVIFENAENYLSGIGRAPINPLTKLPQGLFNLTQRIELLNTCDSIFLLHEWQKSFESRIERYFCIQTGKGILFESTIQKSMEVSREEQLKVDRIVSAIHEVTGLTLDKYCSGPRTNNEFFARLIFSHQARSIGMEPEDIVRYIPGRDKTTILHNFGKYSEEFKVNPKFRAVASRVNEILSSK